MTSTGPSELIVTRPLAFRMQPALSAAAERTILNVVFSAADAGKASASASPILSKSAQLFMESSPFQFSVPFQPGCGSCCLLGVNISGEAFIQPNAGSERFSSLMSRKQRVEEVSAPMNRNYETNVNECQ